MQVSHYLGLRVSSASISSKNERTFSVVIHLNLYKEPCTQDPKRYSESQGMVEG
jgi:hypothetical protein